MLSLTKMSPSSWTYYAEEIATGREDYYALSAERPGAFLGSGAEALGITDLAVDAIALERLFGNGEDPRDGTALGRRFGDDERAVAGFALTFSPPKSVSVLWALGDDTVSESALAGHDAAVGSALAFLEAHAAFTRRGHAGVLQVDTDGLLAASFVHRTSRAADPQLHTHLLVANKVRAADRRWLSLDARELFEHQKAAGMLYKAALRSELTARLGVSWTTVDANGIAEIEGVPAGLADAWSARRQQVKALGAELVATREAELGRSLSAAERAAIFQIAAYRTRVAKVDADTPTRELKTRWHEEAERFGYGAATWLPDVLGREAPRVVSPTPGLVAAVVSRLEERAATFGRSDVAEECARLVSGVDAEATRALVEELTDAVLGDPVLVSLAVPLPIDPPSALRRRDEMSVFERHGAPRFSTTGMLRREASVLDAVARGSDAGVAVVGERIVDAVLGASELGEDQQRALRGVLRDGQRVSLLVGPAGAGKSRALAAARTAWEAAGAHVVGLAPSAMAAAVLGEESAISSETLAKFLSELEGGTLGPSDVVVLDEAGMARSDDLSRLVGAVERAGAKLVLVGDPHQLGAVGPGGLFRTLVGDHGAHELETVRRFAETWEAAATLRLRARDPSVLPTYLAHDRIRDGSRQQMLDEAFSSWAEAHVRGERLLVMAGDNDTVGELSRRCRVERVRRGEVEPGGVALQHGVVGVGDEVVTLRNDRSLRPSPTAFVRNGARWTVTDRGEDGSLRVVALDGEGAVTLPFSYVAEHVGLAYALTIHKAQGTTTERAVVLVDEQMTAEQLYVGMSRGRQENRALVVTGNDAEDEHVRPVPVSALQELAAVIRRDGADRSAHEVLRANLARSEDADWQRTIWRATEEQLTRLVGPDVSARIAALEGRADREASRRDLAKAHDLLQECIAARQTAEERLRALETSPRRRLPGRLGEAARAAIGIAEGDLVQARWHERDAQRHDQNRRAAFAAAEALGNELDALRVRQARREALLTDNQRSPVPTSTAPQPASSAPQPASTPRWPSHAFASTTAPTARLRGEETQVPPVSRPPRTVVVAATSTQASVEENRPAQSPPPARLTLRP